MKGALYSIELQMLGTVDYLPLQIPPDMSADDAT